MFRSYPTDSPRRVALRIARDVIGGERLRSYRGTGLAELMQNQDGLAGNLHDEFRQDGEPTWAELMAIRI